MIHRLPRRLAAQTYVFCTQTFAEAVLLGTTHYTPNLIVKSGHTTNNPCIHQIIGRPIESDHYLINMIEGAVVSEKHQKQTVRLKTLLTLWGGSRFRKTWLAVLHRQKGEAITLSLQDPIYLTNPMLIST